MADKSSTYIKPYVPDILINSNPLNNKSSGNMVISGSLLFADLSGFTAMSENLASLGRLGGEKLANIMNDCFNNLLGLVFALDGDIIKFGGDAFLALFHGQNDVHRAFQCAANLILWINQNGRISTPVGDFKLGIHAGISQGEIFNLLLGDKRREHLFCGLTVEKAYAAADAANLGELALTPEAADKIADLKTEKTDDGFYIYKNWEISNQLEPSRRIESADNKDIPFLESFIISGLEPQLHFNSGVIEGEHRVLTSLFIGVNSLRKNLETDIDKSVAAINEYFMAANNIIEKHGGAFARLDSSGTSEKMLIFFGAPISSGRDAQNCLKAVLEIESILPRLNEKFARPIAHRYGINTGLCFVGDVGGESRREYTAMGDAINLAARLMSKAGYGDILVGDETLKLCGDDFITRDGGLVNVKGKKELIRLNYLEKEIEKEKSDEVIIGREKELQAARGFIDKVKNGIQSLLIISGEPGAGKSLLSSKIKQMAAKAGLGCIEGACYKHSEKTPLGPLKEILAGLLNLDSRSPQKQRRLALNAHMKAIGETEWLPFIAPLLDYYPPVPPQLKNLPEDIKKKKIHDILARLICEINKNKTTLIIIEDIQWVDDSSYEISRALMARPHAPGLMFISRPGKVFDEISRIPKVEAFELKGLSEDDSRKLFLTILGGIIPGQEVIRQVIGKSGGNPFYLEEMAKAFQELGPEKFSAAKNIPGGIESVITARIDNLGEMVKRTVRTASVIGRVFARDVLKAIFPDRKRSGKLGQYLEELAHLDLTPLERRQPILEYFFKHILTQEVAYNGLSFSARKTLHQKTAAYYAGHKRLVKREPEVPARHYLLAEMPENALPFLYLAGQKAADEFANSEALGFYEKVIEIADSLANHEYLTRALQSRGELAKHIGDLKLAESDYLRLKGLVASDVNLMAIALRKLSEIYRLTAEYEKAEIAIDELNGLLPDDIPTIVFCLNGKAEITRRSGKLQACREQLLEALELCEKHDVPEQLIAIIYNNLGVCHWSLGKLKESAKYYKLAQVLYKRSKDLSGQSKVTNNLGIISDELGKLHQAAQSYEKAEKIFKRIGALRMQAFACANWGTNLSARGYLTQAEEKLLTAREIFERIGDNHALGYAVGDLGLLYYRKGDIEKSAKYFQDALKRANLLKDDEFILESKLRLARLCLIRGTPNIDEVLRLFEEAQKVGSAELVIKALLLKGLNELSSVGEANFKQILAQIKSIEELVNYPELELELAKIEIIANTLLGQKSRAAKILNSALKRAVTRDLAIMGSELFIAGQGCDLIEFVPKRIADKIKAIYRRFQTNISSADFEKFNVSSRRRVEFLRNFVTSSINQKGRKPFIPTKLM